MQARGQLRLTWKLYAESPQSGEISRLYGQESIEEGDLSTQRIIGAIPICLPCRHAAPLEMTMLAGSIGHTFGVRVDGAAPRGFLRFLSLTGPLAPRVAVAADAASFIKKGRGWRRRLCRRVVFASLRGRQRLRR